MRPLYDQGDANLYEFGAGADVVDTDEILAMAGALDDVLWDLRAAIAKASAALVLTGAGTVLLPSTGPTSRQRMADLLHGAVALSVMHAMVTELRNDLYRSAAQYAQYELTVSNVIREQQGAMAWVERLGLTMVTMLGIATPVASGRVISTVWNAVEARFGGHMSAGVRLRFQVALGAPLASALVNPLGLVDTRNGVRTWQEMLPASFLIGSLARLLGYHEPVGDVRVSVASSEGWRELVEVEDHAVVTQNVLDPELDGRTISLNGGKPRSVTLEDVMWQMDELGLEAVESGTGRVGVVRQQAPDGRQAWILLIPGTSQWNPLILGNPQDLRANAQLTSDRESDIERAVTEVLETLPIGPDDAILATGHSQGGRTAMEFVSNPDVQDDYNLEGVITLGAPTAGTENLPDDADILMLEHADDPVPSLMGAIADPDENVLTTTFDPNVDIPGSSHPHDMSSYTFGLEAAMVDGTESAEMIEQFEEHALLGVDDVVTTLYEFRVERT